MSVLSQRFADPALGELALAHDAFGIDAQQDIDAVTGPLGNLRGINAATEPGGQAGMPKVIGSPGARRLFRCGQGRLACFRLCAPVGDGGQLADPNAAEEVAVRSRAELREVVPEQPGSAQGGWARCGCLPRPCA